MKAIVLGLIFSIFSAGCTSGFRHGEQSVKPVQIETSSNSTARYSDDEQDPNAKIWIVFKGKSDNNPWPSACMVTTAANPNREGWVPYTGPYKKTDAINVCKRNCGGCY